jgi:hypothetical protein
MRLLDKFVLQLRTGKKVSVDNFLSGQPESAVRLRPALEGAVIVNAAFRELREHHSEAEVKKLLHVTVDC